MLETILIILAIIVVFVAIVAMRPSEFRVTRSATISAPAADAFAQVNAPACRAPRFEPRAAWPRGSPCARSQTRVKGQPGVRLNLSLEFAEGRRHMMRI